jgi:outer membrane protein OmpA-like peptidoglycan-associated protein
MKVPGLVAFAVFVIANLAPAADATNGQHRLRELAQHHVDRGLALGNNSPEEAACYERAAEIDPSYAAARFNLGFVCQTQGDYERAIDAYERCLIAGPPRGDAHRNLASCWLLLRGDAALPKVRRHANAALEGAAGEGAGRLKPNEADGLEAELQRVELRMSELMGPPALAGLTSSPAEMAGVLLRPVKRAIEGQRVYDGPRLVLPLFAAGGSRLDVHARAQLGALADAISTAPLCTRAFVIEGHADGSGSARANMLLSHARAAAVRDCMIRDFGVPSGRLSLDFHGEDWPMIPNSGDARARLNRRVEIVRTAAERE